MCFGVNIYYDFTGKINLFVNAETFTFLASDYAVKSMYQMKHFAGNQSYWRECMTWVSTLHPRFRRQPFPLSLLTRKFIFHGYCQPHPYPHLQWFGVWIRHSAYGNFVNFIWCRYCLCLNRLFNSFERFLHKSFCCIKKSFIQFGCVCMSVCVCAGLTGFGRQC